MPNRPTSVETPKEREGRLKRQRRSWAKHKEKRLAEQRVSYGRDKENRRAWGRAYSATHKPERKARDLQKFYGLSAEQFEAMKRAQDGKCAICNEEKILVVDHCHKTNRVRALLCNACNINLGTYEYLQGFRDQFNSYLRAHQC